MAKASERLSEAEGVLLSAAASLYDCGLRREQLDAEERQLRAQLARAQGAVAVLRDLASEEQRAAKAQGDEAKRASAESKPEIAGSRDPAIAPGAVPSPG